MRLTPRQRKLVEGHIHLVKVLAIQVSKKLPSSVLPQEVESAGHEALCRAALSYRADLGPFDYWARRKMSGAMIDAFKGDRWPKRYSQLGSAPLFPQDPAADGYRNMFHTSAGWAPQGEQRPDPAPDPELSLLAREARQALNARLAAAFRRLSKPELRILEASDNDHTLGEIAEALGVGITTVHRRREAIYAKLRHLLQEAA